MNDVMKDLEETQVVCVLCTEFGYFMACSICNGKAYNKLPNPEGGKPTYYFPIRSFPIILKGL